MELQFEENTYVLINDKTYDNDENLYILFVTSLCVETDLISYDLYHHKNNYRKKWKSCDKDYNSWVKLLNNKHFEIYGVSDTKEQLLLDNIEYFI